MKNIYFKLIRKDLEIPELKKTGKINEESIRWPGDIDLNLFSWAHCLKTTQTREREATVLQRTHATNSHEEMLKTISNDITEIEFETYGQIVYFIKNFFPILEKISTKPRLYFPVKDTRDRRFILWIQKIEDTSRQRMGLIFNACSSIDTADFLSEEEDGYQTIDDWMHDSNDFYIILK